MGHMASCGVFSVSKWPIDGITVGESWDNDRILSWIIMIVKLHYVGYSWDSDSWDSMSSNRILTESFTQTCTING